MISGKKFDKKYFSSGSYCNYKEILGGWVKPIARRISNLLDEATASSPKADSVKMRRGLIAMRQASSPRVLDVGCGFGDLIAELQDRYDFSVVGLEVSPYAIKKASPSVKSKIKGGSILKLPFKKNNFDVVVCFDVVCYLTSEETVRAIKNLIKVSRGYIFFSSIYRHANEASQKINPDPLRRATLSKKEYVDIFSKYGARFVKKFYGENGGDVLIFKKN
jgi:2-polyprenyl-3-methyl-5-hydroxy-6-metoxy-1,4-benzoquinol methylase